MVGNNCATRLMTITTNKVGFGINASWKCFLSIGSESKIIKLPEDVVGNDQASPACA